MDSYMGDYKKTFHDPPNFVSGPPLGGTLDANYANRVNVKDLGHLIPSLEEIQGPSQLHGHDPWLVYEVALITIGS